MRTPDLEALLKNWFPKAVILKQDRENMSRKQSVVLDTFKIHICKIEPVFTGGNEFEGKKVPHQVLEYPMNNATNVFIFKKVFEKVRNKENPTASSFSKNTIFETKFPLPGMLKWAEVVREIENLETTPIQNSLSMLQEKNLGLELTMMKIKQDPNSVPITQFTQLMYGTVIPQVGGGIPKIEEAFINEEYESMNPEDKPYVTKIKDEIKRQVAIIQELLPLHAEQSDNKPMQEAMEEEFQKLKTTVLDKYGEVGEQERKKLEGFRENVLNKIFMEALAKEKN